MPGISKVSGGKMPIDDKTDAPRVPDYVILDGHIYQRISEEPSYDNWEDDAVKVKPADLSSSAARDDNEDHEMTSYDDDLEDAEEDDDSEPRSLYDSTQDFRSEGATAAGADPIDADIDFLVDKEEVDNSAPSARRIFPWTIAEHDHVFLLVDQKVNELDRALTMAEFKTIADDMHVFFAGQSAQVGDQLPSGALVKESFRYPQRNGRAIHSYVTKENMFRAKYNFILRLYGIAEI